ncbi:MAG: hypothetical protein K0Q52_207 [Microbacterium sp.]|jgi:hypothetical protein|nr:hypothetical protein [Microbacterium sp.]
MGVSDPSLIWAVNDAQPNTDEEISIVRSLIRRLFPSEAPSDQTARAELDAMLFGPVVTA